MLSTTIHFPWGVGPSASRRTSATLSHTKYVQFLPSSTTCQKYELWSIDSWLDASAKVVPCDEHGRGKVLYPYGIRMHNPASKVAMDPSKRRTKLPIHQPSRVLRPKRIPAATATFIGCGKYVQC